MIIAPQAHGSKIQVSSPVYSWELDAETDLFSLYVSEKRLSGRQHETRLDCQNQRLDLYLQQSRTDEILEWLEIIFTEAE